MDGICFPGVLWQASFFLSHLENWELLGGPKGKKRVRVFRGEPIARVKKGWGRQKDRPSEEFEEKKGRKEGRKKDVNGLGETREGWGQSSFSCCHSIIHLFIHLSTYSFICTSPLPFHPSFISILLFALTEKRGKERPLVILPRKKPTNDPDLFNRPFKNTVLHSENRSQKRKETIEIE
mmetsp:Transcript_40172/g.79171  ORF Transcript_40172/g.79171 Transcript_40172/m.79171 type:complete len:179 (+) Transcript_40172:3970-4506(+)